jgi:hypothetical protein
MYFWPAKSGVSEDEIAAFSIAFKTIFRQQNRGILKMKSLYFSSLLKVFFGQQNRGLLR